MSLEQLFDPRATAVEDGRRGCVAHRLTIARESQVGGLTKPNGHIVWSAAW
jgi:hypothetical protein